MESITRPIRVKRYFRLDMENDPVRKGHRYGTAQHGSPTHLFIGNGDVPAIIINLDL